MSERLIIFVVMLLCLLPFILYAILTDLTKRQFLVIVGMAVAFGSTASTAAGRSMLHWMVQSERLVPLLLIVGGILIGLFSARFVVGRRRRYRLAWPTKPSQRDFASAGYDMLVRKNWTYQVDVNHTFFNVYWMTLGKQRVMFVFSVGPLEIDILQRTFTTTRIMPAQKVVVVLWDEPLRAMQAILEELGWRFMLLDDFKRSDTNLIETSKASDRPIVVAPATDSRESPRTEQH
ncbi:hypothetical protein [Lichenicola sp.]|uniref:hypothetical protein n=1 Tax=Lichenicola sp. TaxID=2804529 RepID=UPI003B00CD40